jgi:hypothetical protein
MHSWRESKGGWLKVLRGLEKVKEVVFVRELLGYESPVVKQEYRLIELAEVDVAVYEFSGELWRARISMDLEAERKLWPEWKVPNIEFKAITDAPESAEGEGVVVHGKPRKLRDTWRK